MPSGIPVLPHVDDAHVRVGAVADDPLGVDELFGMHVRGGGKRGKQE